MNTKTQNTKKVASQGTSKVVNNSKVVKTQKELQTQKELKAVEKNALIDKVVNGLGVKQVRDKVVNPTKKLVGALVTIERLNAKTEKTNFDKLLLLNATIKVEDITNINKLYNRLKNDYLTQCVDFLGGAKFPTFKEFSEKLPIKFAFSIWDGLNTIYKFNTNAQRKIKAEKHQAKVNAI